MLHSLCPHSAFHAVVIAMIPYPRLLPRAVAPFVCSLSFFRQVSTHTVSICLACMLICDVIVSIISLSFLLLLFFVVSFKVQCSEAKQVFARCLSLHQVVVPKKGPTIRFVFEDEKPCLVSTTPHFPSDHTPHSTYAHTHTHSLTRTHTHSHTHATHTHTHTHTHTPTHARHCLIEPFCQTKMSLMKCSG